MHPAIIIGTVRSLIVDVAMGQIPRSTERTSSTSIVFSSDYFLFVNGCLFQCLSMYDRIFRHNSTSKIEVNSR